MFKRKKKRHVLDRVISLSQPDLLCSAPVGLDGEESPLCGKVNPSSGYSRNISQAGAERMQSDAQTPISSMESKTPTVAYLVQSHHKSSSLGSACLERLSDEPAARNQAVALEEDDQLQTAALPLSPSSVLSHPPPPPRSLLMTEGLAAETRLAFRVLLSSAAQNESSPLASTKGSVFIPLSQFQDGEQKGYVLKNKKLTGPTKGVIYLGAEVIYSSVKAGLRTLVPAEQKYIEEESKLSKHLFQQNFNRVKRCAMVLINAGTYVNSCFEWESSQRSICAFLLFVVCVWNFEVYMLPLALLLILAWNYCFTTSRGTEDMAADAMFEWEEDEEEKDDKDFERKGFMGKLYAIQDVCITVQSGLDEVASYGERIKNVFNWTVPFLSWLAISALCVATFLLYLVPLRYLVLTWGVNKFTKKLRDPYMIDNNELLDFLSRVPSDVQVVQYRELKAEPGQSPNKRKRTNPG
ncbi:multiple C2 and transmembrane domain-containing protein 1 [Osmerus mordax]|uniref:multiple C2 and transmembrane domain-containing protein 1 n=1 Tax=Osmerus mordax TaxID=8014 RepID=UPI00350FB960